MDSTSSGDVAGSRLRFIFDHDVLFFNVAADTTLADVAHAIRGFSGSRYGEPLAIDITLPR